MNIENFKKALDFLEKYPNGKTLGPVASSRLNRDSPSSVLHYILHLDNEPKHIPKVHTIFGGGGVDYYTWSTMFFDIDSEEWAFLFAEEWTNSFSSPTLGFRRKARFLLKYKNIPESFHSGISRSSCSLFASHVQRGMYDLESYIDSNNEISDYEKTIECSIKLEKFLEKTLNAKGKGLHEKVSSVENELSKNDIKNFRLIATLRNKTIHEGKTVENVEKLEMVCNQLKQKFNIS